MEIRGEEVLLPVSAVSAFPRPHWLQGRVLGSLSEPSYRSMNARVAYEDACKICAREQENAGLDILCDGAQYYEWEAPGFQLEPIFHFIPENLGGFVPYGPPGDGEQVIPLGQARVVRPGRDVTLAALSITVGTCLAAASALADEGVEAEVIDLRTLVPLDAAAVLGSVARTGRLVVVEENPGQLGWGASVAAIAAQEAFGALAAPVTRVSGGNVPLPVAASLEAEVDVTAARVAGAVRGVLGASRPPGASQFSQSVQR